MRKLVAEHPDEYWDKVVDINLMHSLFFFTVNLENND